MPSEICISIEEVSKHIAGRVLFEPVSFGIHLTDRIGLVGVNGTGKSTLIKILAKLEPATSGEITYRKELSIGYLPQIPELDYKLDVLSQVLCEADFKEEEHWETEHKAKAILSRLKLTDYDKPVALLSGGQKRKVDLARVLLTQPDVLLLDEPTNHLDLDSIEWLEDLLIAFKGSVVTITHDRTFLDRVATRIVELDRGKLRSYPGNFAQYLVLKEDQIAQEAVVSAKADKLLAQEEIWIRKGVEARRTRSQSRIVRLQNLRASHRARREAVGNVRMDVASGALGGKLVAELTQACKAFGDKVIIKDFSATIMRGDKIGLLGPNGAGKTTLLKLILGELQPDSGKVRQGANLQVAYFDQMRNALDLDATLEDFISPGSEWIEIGSQRKHVKSYLGDFLFSPARANSPVRSLSGGERNRLLLARLFARPANVLVLDEPTNDLDIETLELLEELLQSYEGTVFLVSHDRTFLDNVVTSTIACEGNGLWREYEGGIQDWLTQSRRSKEIELAASSTAAAPQPTGARGKNDNKAADLKKAAATKKLGHREQRELEGLPARIETLEQEQAALRVTLADASLYAKDPARASELYQRDAAIEEEMLTALARWEALSTA